ncbi:cutinase family protein [Mycolicibacterium peregrinum]|uniref:cutinase family protein n=1 Tax=Mycolicibacterium peregrinum TaxID=43304 RepID=UPI0006D812DE|nr:cutinase family protein [Mycolicibacterium peregrinum]MCV7202281.1 cutinase family protein [Mycolicibacterium peregrinum]ORW60392.1 cutinase [Mycolicibacterium peregrinum]
MSTAQRARKGSVISTVAQSTIFTALALAALVFGSLAGPIASANAADGCADVEVVFARGTNEAPGVGATGQAFVDALSADLPGKSVDVYAVNYPASLDFGQATDGIADASNRIQSIAATCPATKIVLGGYSQGAAVAGYTTSSSVPAGYVLPAGISGPMPASVASHVAAVALFGTPDEWVLGLADRSAPPIAIGAPYVAKTIQLCAPGDPICFPGGLNRAAHSSYKDNGMAIQAADFAARQLGGSAPAATMVQTAGEVTGN